MTDPLVAAALGVALLSLLWAFIVHRRLQAFVRARERLFSNVHANDLEVLLSDTLERLDRVEEDARRQREFGVQVRHQLRRSLVSPTIRRYNSYADIAGSQSFSLAFIDRDRNGFVMSSLVSREGHRLYIKPLAAGVSESPLSDEERAVLDDAVASIELL